MTQQIINTGSGPNAQDGDSLYVAFTKVNENFSNIWTQGPVDSNISIANNAIISTDVNGNIVLMPNGIGYAKINATAIPGANNTYFLGDSSRRWRGIYAGSAGINTTGNLYAGNLIISGNTTYSGDITFGGNVGISQELSVIGNITGDSNLNVTGSLTAGPATFAGNVAITGNLQVAGNIIYIDVEQLRVHDPIIEIGTGPNGAPLTSSDGYSRGLLMDYFNTTANVQQLGFMGLAGPNYTTYQFLTNATDLGNVFTGTPANLTFGNATASGLLSAAGNIIGGNIVTVGNVSATANISGANLLTGGNISAEGGVIGDTLYANTSVTSGNTISAAGNITGAYILGNGRYLSGIDTTLISSGTSRVQILAADGNIIANVAGNTIGSWTPNGYSVAGNISTDSYYVGNGRYLTGVVADSIANALSTLTVTGNITTGNLNTAGNVTGNYILGNGALLTGVITSVANINNGTSNVSIAAANGNITMSVNGVADIVDVNTSGIDITGTISTTGNASVLGILTDNIYYANGQPYHLQQPGGSNTQVQFNDNNDFNGSAAFTFDSSANALAVSGNISGGNLRTVGLVSATGNVIGGNLRTTGAVVGGTGSFLSDVTIYGNLQVGGNIVYVDVTELRVADPVIEMGGGPNGTPLTADDGFSRGLKLDYFNDTANAAQFGFFGLAATDYTTYQFLTNAADTANTFTGTAANLYFGNASATGNIATGGILTDGYYYANGQPLDMQQPSGSNTWIQYNDNGNFGATTNFTFDAANQVFYIGGFATITGNVIGGNLYTGGIVSAAGNIYGATLFGDIQGNIVSDAISVSGNIDAGNLRTAGVITATGTVTGGNLATSGTVSATGNATFGNISSGGNITTAGILTDNYYYANGQPIDMQQPAGSNTQIQFNNNNDFGASANLTFNSATNTLTVTGVISSTGNLTSGNILTGGLISATGNITGGNIAGTFVSPAANTQVLFNDTGVIGGNSQFTFDKVGNTLTIGTTGGTVRAAYVSTPQAGVDLTLLPSTGITRSYGNLVPQFANTYDLGGSGTRWNNFWANVANIVTLNTIGNINGSNLLLSGTTSATGNIIGGNISSGGNAVVGGILTNNYYYANGQPLDMQQPAGSNTQIQFNNNNDFGASSSLTFDSNTNQFYVGGVGSFSGNVIGGNLRTAGVITATGNIDGGNLSGEYIIGTLTTAAQPNITSVGTLTSLNSGAISSSGNITGANLLTSGIVSATGNVTGNVVSGNVISSVGNAYIGGNLYVTGNVTYINITDLNVQDPIISMGRGPNNTPLTVNDGYDRGEQLWYYTSSEKSAFIGWDNSTNNLIAALDVTNSGEVISVNNWGNFVVGNLYAQALNSADILFVNTGSNVVTVGNSTVTTGATFAVNATDSMLVPVGNTFQRPGTPVVGMVRFNTTLDAFEYYSSVDGWTVGGGGGSTSLTSQTFTADGSTVAFTLTNASTTVDSLVMINGVTQIPTSSYSIVGTTLTFTEPPEAGDTIEVREITAQATVHAITNSSGNASISVDDSAAHVEVTGNLIPSANVTYDLGSPTARWKDLYLANSTLYLGSQALSSDGTILTFDGNPVITSTSSSSPTISVAGNITGQYIYGNGAYLTGISGSTANLAGNLTGNLQGNGFGANAFTFVSATGNVTGGNITTAGNVTGAYILGNAAFMSGIPASYGNSNVVANLAALGSNPISTTGNVTSGNINSSGGIYADSATGEFIIGDRGNASATKTRIVSNTTFTYIQTGNGTAGSTGNVVFAPYSSATQRVVINTGSGNLTAAGNIIGGNITTAGLISATGNITGGNILGGANVNATTHTGTTVSVTGNITSGNISTGIISASGNVTAQNFIGNISITGNVTGTSSNVQLVAGIYTTTFDNTGNTALANGTVSLTTLSGSGNITGGNVLTGGLISATGNITGGNLSITGNVVGDIAFTGANILINNAAGAGGSDEGGQINFAAATANSTLSGPIAIDVYQNKMRFFETTGNNRGMFIDLANAMGVGGSSTGVPAIGYRDVPQVSFSANTTAAATDAGKHYYSTTAGNLALTLPDNSNVAFSTGATLTIVVNAAGNVLVNAAAGVTLYLAGSSTAGNRVVGAYGLASVMKVAANTWVISGTGVY